MNLKHLVLFYSSSVPAPCPISDQYSTPSFGVTLQELKVKAKNLQIIDENVYFKNCFDFWSMK